jgi:hypothetical protein
MLILYESQVLVLSFVYFRLRKVAGLRPNEVNDFY